MSRRRDSTKYIITEAELTWENEGVTDTPPSSQNGSFTLVGEGSYATKEHITRHIDGKKFHL